MATGMEMMVKSFLVSNGINVEDLKQKGTALLDTVNKFDAKLDTIIESLDRIEAEIEVVNRRLDFESDDVTELGIGSETSQGVVTEIEHLDTANDPTVSNLKVDPNEVSMEELEVLAQKG